jgi:hypothetical protein
MTGTRRTKRKTPTIIKTKGNVINDLRSQEVASCTGPSTQKTGTMGSEKQSYSNRVPQPTLYRLPLYQELTAALFSFREYRHSKRNAMPVPTRTIAQTKTGLTCVKSDESKRIAAIRNSGPVNTQ